MLSRSQKTVFLAVLALALLVLGGIWAWQHFAGVRYLPAAEQLSSHETLPSCTQTGTCTLKNIAASGNRADCQQLPVDQQAECLRQATLVFALKTLDLAVCDELVVRRDQSACRANLIYKQAFLSRDASWCAEIELPFQRQQCQDYFAKYGRVARPKVGR